MHCVCHGPAEEMCLHLAMHRVLVGPSLLGVGVHALGPRHLGKKIKTDVRRPLDSNDRRDNSWISSSQVKIVKIQLTTNGFPFLPKKNKIYNHKYK